VVDGRSIAGAPEGAIGTSNNGRVSGRFTVAPRDEGDDK
jgi:hypothetical protein